MTKGGVRRPDGPGRRGGAQTGNEGAFMPYGLAAAGARAKDANAS